MRRIVYRVLLGGYESLNELDDVDLGDVEAILLTDDAHLTSRTWTVHQVAPEFPDDPVRSQRLLKICGHPALGTFDESLYIDNTVELRVAPGALLDAWLSEPATDIALPLHDYRDSVADEFTQVLALGLDDAAPVREQLSAYGRTASEILLQRPYWTAILARRTGDALDSRMRIWADHVLRYSRRDQLSVNLALDSTEIAVAGIDLTAHESPWHRWPVDSGRPEGGGRFVGPTSASLVLEMRRLRERLEKAGVAAAEGLRVREALASEVAGATARAAERDLEIRGLRAERAALEGDRDAALHRARSAAEEADGLRDQNAALKASTSWRLTAPLRRVSRWVRRG
ncbi:glycosyltransferase domain-containing protein [Leifsonia sp. YIM 134122]|uniref:Glycosyltransferase domain-containing protein n=1 Tax=Leifsonia stereocauli TaxID=3134136 RepID=A0ABU9W3K3_9MICO